MPEMKKIVLLGAPEVGKTAIVGRITQGFFPYSYEPTVEDMYRHDVALLGKTETVEIVDTTGEIGPEGDNVRNMHAVFADAFIVVYSVKSRTSYDRARHFLDRISEIKPNAAKIPVLVVANQAGRRRPDGWPRRLCCLQRRTPSEQGRGREACRTPGRRRLPGDLGAG